MFELRSNSRVALTLALALTALSADALFSQAPQPDTRRRIAILDGREVIEGEVIVRYRERMGRIQRERAEFQAQSAGSEPVGRLGARRMRSKRLNTRQMIETLRANPDVEFVEPNYVIRANAIPNDSSFGSLWGLHNTGQVVDGRAGTPGMDVSAAAAWDVTQGSRANVIAVLDTGIDHTHPDLAANIWSAPRQFSVTVGSTTITCAAGTHGYNAITNTCIAGDDNGHGTHVAGIIGAVGNNGLGVTGVNWTASMMSIKVLGVDGLGSSADAIEAIDWLIKTKSALGADANIRILNASWGSGTVSQALDAEIQNANNADMLFVAAAGSDGNSNDVIPHHPATSSVPNVLSVGAFDNTGKLASYSNYGANTVDLTAPGDSSLSTLPGNQYGRLSGTSMSAPFAAGVAGLVLAACPMNTATLKSTLMSSVEPDASMAGKTVSGGRINADAAIQRCLATRPSITLTPASVAPGGALSANVANGPGNTTDWIGLYPVGGTSAQRIDWKYLNGQQTPPSTAMTSATVPFTAPTTAGSYEVRLFMGNSTVVATSGPATVGTQSTISINDVSVTEGNSGTATATFTVTVSPVNTTQTVTVNYATANGTATAGTDYTAVSGTLTFAPSAATRTISVPVTGDTASEPNETFVVNLSGAINGVIGDGQGTGTITNDDAAACTACPTVTAPASAAPGATITFQVANGPGGTMDWVALYNASTTEDRGNYLQWQFLNGSQTPPSAGRTSATLTFVAPQTPGTYNIRFFANGGYTKLATSNDIAVGVTTPSLSINDVTVNEGQGGTTTATFTVTLSPVNSAQTVTVNYATANGTATTADNDYTSASGTLSFAPSAATRTVTVTVNGDTAVESNETFSVNLSGATNATIVDGQGIGTIVNDDQPACTTCPTVTAPANVAPGGTITFQIANGPANPMDWVGLYNAGTTEDRGNYLQWQFLNGAQTAPSSGRSSATLTFTAPQTPGSYNIRFFANGGYTKLATSNAITVGNPTPSLTINDVTVSEGNSGTVNATFTVTVAPVNSSQTVTVNYATANNTATAGTDYTAVSGTLTFAPSVATQTITVPVIGDTAVEPNEAFHLNLSGASNATLSDAQGVGTIVNDDAAGCTSCPTVTAPTSVSPGATITFQIANGPANPMDWVGFYNASTTEDRGNYLQWQFLNGSQSAPATGRSSATLTFTAPSTPGNYDIRFFANGGYTKLATSNVITVGTPSPSLTINNVTVNEGNSGSQSATFTVTLSPVNTSQTVTVNYATANGTATTADNDYSAASGTLTFAPSVGTQTITVPILGDTAVEPDETFTVNLSGASNASISDATGVGTIVSDDVAASGTSITLHNATVARGGTITFTISNGPANPMDWVGLYAASTTDDRGNYLQWQFLNGSQSPPSAGVSSATLTFVAPATAGSYNIRFFANGGYTKLATSATITVQ